MPARTPNEPMASARPPPAQTIKQMESICVTFRAHPAPIQNPYPPIGAIGVQPTCLISGTQIRGLCSGRDGLLSQRASENGTVFWQFLGLVRIASEIRYGRL
jgi:hypothetical protein